MLCLICGFICDPTPSKICVVCQREIDCVNERVEMMYLLREAYKSVPEIWLRERIERLFEMKGKPL